MTQATSIVIIVILGLIIVGLIIGLVTTKTCHDNDDNSTTTNKESEESEEEEEEAEDLSSVRMPVLEPTMFDIEAFRALYYTQAHRCHDTYGVFPCNFAFMGELVKPSLTTKTKKTSSIVPGHKYTFDSQESYYHEYATSNFALTFKKAGWDCMRHIEILANNCVPLMLDIDECPEFTMVGYPKKVFSCIRLTESFWGAIPHLYTFFQHYLYEHTLNFLTARSNWGCILDILDLPFQIDRVLFIDCPLADKPDYLSMSILAGLAHTYNASLHVAVAAPEYMTKGTKYHNTTKLYGRGFSYTGVVDSFSTCDNDSLQNNIRNHMYDIVVYGSVTRSQEYWNLVTSYYQSNEILAFVGVDVPWHVIKPHLDSNIADVATMFVREIES